MIRPHHHPYHHHSQNNSSTATGPDSSSAGSSCNSSNPSSPALLLNNSTGVGLIHHPQTPSSKVSQFSFPEVAPTHLPHYHYHEEGGALYKNSEMVASSISVLSNHKPPNSPQITISHMTTLSDHLLEGNGGGGNGSGLVTVQSEGGAVMGGVELRIGFFGLLGALSVIIKIFKKKKKKRSERILSLYFILPVMNAT